LQYFSKTLEIKLLSFLLGRSYGLYSAESTYVVLRVRTMTSKGEIHWIGPR